MPRCGYARWRLRAEELHEASLDLFVALLELIGVGVEQLQVAELRFVRGVRDAGMARVETLGVGEHLLHLFAEGEVREELGGGRVRRPGGDRRRGDDQRHAFLRVHDLDRVPLLLGLVEGVVVASGERPVAVNGGDYTFYQTKKKGNPVEIVYPKEGVPLVVSPTAIAAGAPHPTAAKLFTDFTFSKEVQQVLADTEGLYTGHPGVTYPADKPKLGDLKLLHTDPDELEKRNEEIKRRFVEFFGA